LALNGFAMTVLPILLLIALGSIAGITTSLLGLGGSLVVVPGLLALLPILDMDHESLAVVALGTSMSVSFCTAVLATRAHLRVGSLQAPFSADKVALMFWAGAGAAAGSLLFPTIPKSMALIGMAGFQLVAAGVILVLCHRRTMPSVRSPSQRLPDNVETAHVALNSPGGQMYFALVGCMTSMGMGGALITPYLALRQVEQRRAVALAAWLGLGIGAVCVAVYASQGPTFSTERPALIGSVHWPAAICIAGGSALGVRLGASLAKSVNQVQLRAALALALIASSTRMVGLWIASP
jgi:uncharacterized membrane protein YfcA